MDCNDHVVNPDVPNFRSSSDENRMVERVVDNTDFIDPRRGRWGSKKRGGEEMVRERHGEIYAQEVCSLAGQGLVDGDRVLLRRERNVLQPDTTLRSWKDRWG